MMALIVPSLAVADGVRGRESVSIGADEVVTALDGANLDLLAIQDVTVNEAVNSTTNVGSGDLGLIKNVA